MGVLVLTCPTKRREFSIGVAMEEDSFLKLPDVVTKLRCPECGMMHRWWTHEARVVNEAPRRQI
jgi:hypothetical protein